MCKVLFFFSIIIGIAFIGTSSAEEKKFTVVKMIELSALEIPIPEGKDLEIGTVTVIGSVPLQIGFSNSKIFTGIRADL
jgi:hypothetical protein